MDTKNPMCLKSKYKVRIISKSVSRGRGKWNGMGVPRCTGKMLPQEEGFNWVLLDKIVTGKTRIYRHVN